MSEPPRLKAVNVPHLRRFTFGEGIVDVEIYEPRSAPVQPSLMALPSQRKRTAANWRERPAKSGFFRAAELGER